MNPQFLADGLVAGAMIGLGAIGVTLTYSILRFSNFAHGEFISWGAYATLVIAGILGYLAPGSAESYGDFSVGWGVLVATLLAMVLTGGLALLLDWLLFARLRARGAAITVVMASFGASMALRSLLEFIFTSSPRYFSRDLQIAREVLPGIRVTPDQTALLGLTVVLAALTHMLLTYTQTGRAMRRSAKTRHSPALPASTSTVSSASPGFWAACSPQPPASCLVSSCRSGPIWVLTCCCRSLRAPSSAASAACPARSSAHSSLG